MIVEIPPPPPQAQGVAYETLWMNYNAYQKQNARLLEILKTRDYTIHVLLRELDRVEAQATQGTK